MTTLRSKVLTGLYWSGSARLLGQLFTWGITLVVIRVLRPEDYGLLAMATVFVAFLTLMADIGLGQALVQATRLDEGKLRQVFGAIVAIDVLLFALQFAIAPWIADFFAEPRLATIVRVLSVSFLLAIFSAIPSALMSRELDFKRVSLIELGCAVLGSITTLVMALNDHGVWSLVAGSLVNQAGKTVACNVVRPFLQWPRLSFDGVRELLVFGGQMTLSRVLWFIYSQADMFIAGKLLGKEPLGVYSVAMHLASLPVQKISAIVNQVAFPAFARAREEEGLAAQYLMKAVRLLSFFSFPVLWGLSAVSPELVAALLGAQWAGAVLPLQILSLVMPLRMIGNFVPAATDGVGRADVGLKNLLVSNAAMLPAFAIGAHWGLVGLCMAWILASPCVFLINMRSSLAVLELRLPTLLRAMARPAACAALMAAAIVAARSLLAPIDSVVARLLLLLATGALTYVLASCLLNMTVLREILALRRRAA
jgi:teichuronic acid exporter